MIDCPECDGNGVIVVGKFGKDLMVQVCTVCDGEGEIYWQAKACLPGNC